MVLHFYYTLYDGKYDCKITAHLTIFQLQFFVLLNNHQYNCNITKSFRSVGSLLNDIAIPHEAIQYVMITCAVYISRISVTISMLL